MIHFFSTLRLPKNSESPLRSVSTTLVVRANTVNPLLDMPMLGSSNSAANKDMMSKYGQTGIQLSDCIENIVGKGEIARYAAISPFPTMFSKAV